MRGLSVVVIIAAIVLGAFTVMGVRGIIQNRPAQLASTDSPKVAVGTVVVARTPLAFGTELSPELLREAQWPNESRPEGAFSSIEELLGNERRVALRSIAPNEPVLKDKVSGYGGRAALSQIIEEGMRAVTIRVNDVSGAGGFVLPGDRVDILHTVNPSGDLTNTVTNILLQDIRVLAIDQTADESQEGAMVVKAATVEVTPFDAQKIALAAKVGELSLSLRNAGAANEEGSDERTKTVKFKDLSPAQPPREEAAAPRPSPYSTMRITRGTQRSTQSVVRERSSAASSQVSSRTRLQSYTPASTTAAVTTESKIVGAAPDLPRQAAADGDPTPLQPNE